MDNSRKPDVIFAIKQVMIDSQGDRDLAPGNAPLNPSDWHLPMLTECKRVKNKLRVVRVVHHKELSSLRNGEHLLSGWRDCFECHSALWKKGIEHGDISLRNLMWNPFLKVGVLNDFDLTNIPGEDSKAGRRTWTIAFMALQLIMLDGEDPIRRLYRHDVESLIWVLIWICLYFSEPDDINEGMKEKAVENHMLRLQEWKTGDAYRAYQVRWAFLLLLNNRVPCKAYRELWNLTKKLGLWVKRKGDETVEGLNCTEEVEIIHKQIVDIIKDYESRD